MFVALLILVLLQTSHLYCPGHFRNFREQLLSHIWRFGQVYCIFPEMMSVRYLLAEAVSVKVFPSSEVDITKLYDLLWPINHETSISHIASDLPKSN